MKREKNQIWDEEIKYLLYKQQWDQIRRKEVEDTKIQLSQEKREKVEDLIQSFIQQEKRQTKEKQQKRKYIQHAMGALCGVLLMVLMVVGPQNIYAAVQDVFRVVTDQMETYTQYFFHREVKGSMSTILEIGFVPKGYQLVKEGKDSLSSWKSFEKGEKILDIQKYNSNEFGLSFDNEDTMHKKMQVEGKDITYFEKNSVTTLFWQDNGFVYILSAEENLDTCKKIIKKIK